MKQNVTTNKSSAQTRQIKIQFLVIVAAGIGAALCGCGTAKVSGRHEIGAAPKPALIYVFDFDLDASGIKSEPGPLPSLPKMPGPLGEISSKIAEEVVQRTKRTPELQQTSL